MQIKWENPNYAKGSITRVGNQKPQQINRNSDVAWKKARCDVEYDEKGGRNIYDARSGETIQREIVQQSDRNGNPTQLLVVDYAGRTYDESRKYDRDNNITRSTLISRDKDNPVKKQDYNYEYENGELVKDTWVITPRNGETWKVEREFKNGVCVAIKVKALDPKTGEWVETNQNMS